MYLSMRRNWLLVVPILFMLLLPYFWLMEMNSVQKIRHIESNFYDISSLSARLQDYIRTGFTKPHSLESADIIYSERLGGNRDIPDTREESCKSIMYNLPATPCVSVIITFINEPRSTLLRTITSIIKRTPTSLLSEIIVIDDFSDDKSVGEDLNFLPFVKPFRNQRREGVIKSRNIGAVLATGKYIVFLDSHCEVNTGWMEPLLARLFSNAGVAVSPVVDSIDPKTFQYQKSVSYLKGGFDWNLQFQWIPISTEERESKRDSSAPFMSPSFPGGIFMISKEWFLNLNRFDRNLEIWGGESTEMALKIWLCGGQIEIVPCSRIGHIFSEKHTFTFPKGKYQTYLRNSKIIAESWLDEYKEFFYTLKPDARDISLPPDDDDVGKIKRDLQCRPFSWYLQNIFKELKYPYSDYAALGELKNGAKCLTATTSKVFLRECNHFNKDEWVLHAKSGMLSASSGGCLTASKKAVSLKNCRNKDKQKWARRGGQLIHNATGLCLENYLEENVGIGECRRGAPFQLFSFSVEVQKI